MLICPHAFMHTDLRRKILFFYSLEISNINSKIYWSGIAVVCCHCHGVCLLLFAVTLCARCDGDVLLVADHKSFSFHAPRHLCTWFSTGPSPSKLSCHWTSAQNSLTQPSKGLISVPVLGCQPPLSPGPVEPSDVPAVDDWLRQSERVLEWDPPSSTEGSAPSHNLRQCLAVTYPDCSVEQKVWLSTRDI